MANSDRKDGERARWRDAWNQVIFGQDTFAGRLFDLGLMILILLSVLTVLLESVRSIRESYGASLRVAEWCFTSLFTIEYIARLISADSAKRYARSFFGIVDLLAVAPVYVSLLFGTAHAFTVVRSLRLLRVFRILKLSQYVGVAANLRIALNESLRKIAVFLLAVVTIVVVVSALMY
ncbi:MAG TPA: ion transporter, partial [Terriglobales bacterium]